MNLRTLLTTGLLVALTSTQAQDWSSDVYHMGELYPGYIIDAAGVKTEGWIKYQDPYTMQHEVLFWTDKDNKKSKQDLKTKDLKEYKVADKLYHCINYSGGLIGSAVRANLVVKDGCIVEYVWYSRAADYDGGGPQHSREMRKGEYQSKGLNIDPRPTPQQDNYNAILVKHPDETEQEFMMRKYPPATVYNKPGDEKPRSLDYFVLKFKDKMATYVGDNAELAKKVKGGEKGYEMLDFQAIINEYNAACTK